MRDAPRAAAVPTRPDLDPGRVARCTGVRLRTGLGILTAVAVFAVLAVGGPAWRDHWTAWRDRPDPDALARAVERADRAVRREAEVSVRYLVTGETRDRAELAATRVATDRSLRSVRDHLADAPRPARAVITAFVADWSNWGTERIGIDRRTVADTQALARFDDLTGASVRAADALAAIPRTDTDHRRAIALLARARSALASQQRGLDLGLARAELPAEVLASLRAVPGTLDATLRPARRLLARAGVDLGPFDRAHARTAALTATARSGTLPAGTATDWERRARAEQAGLDRAVAGALGVAAASEGIGRTDAVTTLRTTTVLLGAALAAVLATGLLVDRRIRRRTRAAARVRAAPATVVAEAAPSEAGLLRALVRRNDPLLDRHRALLHDLDAASVHPDERAVVAEIDGLATRMRRNSDSVLALAGLDPERAPTRATALADVVRDAVAEMTRYSRVDVVGLPPAIAVAGPVVDDLVHLLAELIENAGTFSTTTTPVRVVGRRTETGVELAVVDAGIGMDGPDVDEWNRVLAAPAEATVRPGRAIGLAVVARLAARIGATVRLHSRPATGTCAVVSLPGRLLEPVDGSAPAPTPEVAPTVTATGDGPVVVEPAAVQFTPVPAPRPAGPPGGGRHHPGRRRPRHLPSTGTLHQAPPGPRPSPDRDGPSLSR